MTDSPKTDEGLRTSILLAQYEACSVHHSAFYSLIWQIPAVAIAIGGGLTTLVFGSAVSPILRILLLFIGTIFMAAMTIALERFRMFQMRRRKDLQELEKELTSLGARQISWEGDTIVREIRSGEFRARGVHLYRFEGFQLLRGMMYLITIGLFILTVLTIFAAVRGHHQPESETGRLWNLALIRTKPSHLSGQISDYFPRLRQMFLGREHVSETDSHRGASAQFRLRKIGSPRRVDALDDFSVQFIDLSSILVGPNKSKTNDGHVDWRHQLEVFVGPNPIG